MADIVEAWLWAPPSPEMVDRIRARHNRGEQRGTVIPAKAPDYQTRDRYYTQARRLHVKQLMREKP